MKQPSECQRLRETDKLRPVFTSDQIVQLIPAVKFRPSGRRDTAGVVRLPAAFLISLQFGFGLRCASDSFKKLRLDRLTLRLDRLLGFRRDTLHQMILKSLLSVFHAGFRRSESALDLERLLLPLSDHIGFTAGAEDHKSMRSLRVDLRDRGEAGSTSALIPAGWNKAALFIYAYAVSADGKYSSPSTRLYPPPTAEELTLAEAVEAYEAAQLRLAVREVTATPEEREAITRAKAGVKKATAAAEKEAVKAKKSPFEIKLAGLEAATRQLKIES